ncbi:MAG TPA: hypothetical protein VG900_16465 [Hyphomicrobiaceae bacterium]|jgi:hypothetical protein|nr:hypothetical protein [Hyphomicrobiaceae bacterium]
MQDRFIAQTLVESRITGEGSQVELTFTGGDGGKHTLSLPRRLAGDLVAVLASLASDCAADARTELTKLPQRWALGAAAHEKLVLLRFDDDPPYALDVETARDLCNEFSEQILDVEQSRAPALQ